MYVLALLYKRGLNIYLSQNRKTFSIQTLSLIEIKTEPECYSKREILELDYFSGSPDKIICEILLKLPSKSLFKCTTVCKSWSYMIQNSTFINSHISRTIRSNNQNDNNQLFMIQAQPNRDNPPFSEHTKLIIPFPSVPYKWRNLDLAINVLGTCNKFVCIIPCEFHHKDVKVIWNTCNRSKVCGSKVMIQVQMITRFWDFLYQPTHVKFRFGP